jgi:hypothetical protein
LPLTTEQPGLARGWRRRTKYNLGVASPGETVRACIDAHGVDDDAGARGFQWLLNTANDAGHSTAVVVARARGPERGGSVGGDECPHQGKCRSNGPVALIVTSGGVNI